MIKIEKPNLFGVDYMNVFAEVHTNEEFSQEIKKSQNPTYKSWKKIKYNQNFNPKELWIGTKLIRQINSEEIIIKDESGAFFKFWELPRYRKFFQEFDSVASGKDFSIDQLHQKIFIQNGIMEEAIQSSRIEGAVTSRKDAQRMIRESKMPRNKSEQMILNNYESIQKIQSEWKNQDLSLELLFEIHFSITKKTDLKDSETYRLRKNSDNVNVVDSYTDEIAHICPDEKFVKEEIDRLILFANDKFDSDNDFLHPLTKAIILHFWIGYLHPFVDGNGRTARAVFYWYLLKNGYWAIPFIPISNKIIKSPKQYRDAFLQTEQDDLDFNYFFDFNIQKLKLSIKDFYEEIKNLKSKKTEESRLLQKNFNNRQISLLQYFWHNPKSSTTFKTHSTFHNIHLLTSRADILNLEERGCLFRKKSGNLLYFFSKISKINELFKE